MPQDLIANVSKFVSTSKQSVIALEYALHLFYKTNSQSEIHTYKLQLNNCKALQHSRNFATGDGTTSLQIHWWH